MKQGLLFEVDVVVTQKIESERFDVEPPCVNDKVQRKRGDSSTGIILSIVNGKCKVKWDEKSSTGQQHSTVDIKSLKKCQSTIIK